MCPKGDERFQRYADKEHGGGEQKVPDGLVSAERGGECGEAAFLFTPVLRFTTKRRESKIKLGRAADDMFYEFMFEDDIAPVKRLADGLKAKGAPARPPVDSGGRR